MSGFAVSEAASLSGLLIFGSYLTDNPLAEFPLSVLHLVGTLDGGQARPTRMAETYSELTQLQVTTLTFLTTHIGSVPTQLWMWDA